MEQINDWHRKYYDSEEVTDHRRHHQKRPPPEAERLKRSITTRRNMNKKTMDNKEDESKYKMPFVTKIYRGINDEEFETDESMKNYEFYDEDDESSSDQSQPDSSDDQAKYKIRRVKKGHRICDSSANQGN